MNFMNLSMFNIKFKFNLVFKSDQELKILLILLINLIGPTFDDTSHLIFNLHIKVNQFDLKLDFLISENHFQLFLCLGI